MLRISRPSHLGSAPVGYGNNKPRRNIAPWLVSPLDNNWCINSWHQAQGVEKNQQEDDPQDQPSHHLDPRRQAKLVDDVTNYDNDEQEDQ
jgi:hypothetical protein